jgi:hypothetical protein
MTTPDDSADTSISVNLTDDPFPDQKHEDFFKWVGVCIKEWANIEKGLFDICSFVLAADPKHVSIIYYRTPSLEGRLSLTNDLLQSFFPKTPGEHDHPKMIIWTNILGEIRDLVSARNFLAHSPITHQISVKVQLDQNLSSGKIIGHDSWLEVATSANEKLKTGVSKSLRVDDLPAHHSAVRALWKRLVEFSENLKSEPSSKSSAQNAPHQSD